MTEPTPADDATPKPEQKPDGETGTSLAPASGEPSGIDPFIAAASEPPAPPESRPFYAKALDYGAHAAMIVGLVGFAWTVSGHVVAHHGADAPAPAPVKLADTGTATPAAEPSAKPKPDEMAELRKSNQTMASEIRNLHASLEALRTTVVRERSVSSSGDSVRALSASLDGLKSSLAGTRSEQSTAISQLTAKVEKLQREAKAAQPMPEHVAAEHAAEHVVDHSPKPEHRELDTASTASIPAPAPKSVPTPPTKPTVLASTEPTHEVEEAARADKPPVVSGWVVRDVYRGVALIEGRRGQMEVVPGVSIPGGGTVKSIERHSGAWTVTTTKGEVASAAPQREPHHGYERDYYGPRRWGY